MYRAIIDVPMEIHTPGSPCGKATCLASWRSRLGTITRASLRATSMGSRCIAHHAPANGAATMLYYESPLPNCPPPQGQGLGQLLKVKALALPYRGYVATVLMACGKLLSNRSLVLPKFTSKPTRHRPPRRPPRRPDAHGTAWRRVGRRGALQRPRTPMP